MAEDKVLDLGCGYGVIGTFAARLLGPQRVFMIDNDPEAVACAQLNAHRNGVDGVGICLSDGFQDFRETGFTKILCNPPYHRDFSVAKLFIEKGFNRLVVGRSMWMVTKRDAWYRNKLTNIFGGVRVISKDAYFIFEALKKHAAYASHRTSKQD
jgi:16S rRNA (guanine1207-N2)-methyltransferase